MTHHQPRAVRAASCGLSFLLLAAVSPPIVTAQDFGLPRARPEEIGFSTAALERIVPALRASFVEAGKISGFVVVVARNGQLVLFDSAGLMDIETRRPMPGNAVFRIRSMYPKTDAD